MKITEKQAAKVLSWLRLNPSECWTPTIDYLYSAEGQEALLKKVRKRCSVIFADSPFDNHKENVTLFPNNPNGRSCGNGKAQTCQHALLLAILGMLKGGGG